MRDSTRLAPLRLAADCRFLRSTIEPDRRDGPLVNYCTQPFRDGFHCVGPFMDEVATECGLWEPSADALKRG